MSSHNSRMPDKRRRTRRPVAVRLTVAIGGGTGTVATVFLLARHVLRFPDAAVFGEIAAIITLIVIAVIALAMLADIVAHSRLRYRAGKRAVDTAKSNDQAIKTYRVLDSSSPLKRGWRRLLGLPAGWVEDEEDATL